MIGFHRAPKSVPHVVFSHSVTDSTGYFEQGKVSGAVLHGAIIMYPLFRSLKDIQKDSIKKGINISPVSKKWFPSKRNYIFNYMLWKCSFCWVTLLHMWHYDLILYCCFFSTLWKGPFESFPKCNQAVDNRNSQTVSVFIQRNRTQFFFWKKVN